MIGVGSISDLCIKIPWYSLFELPITISVDHIVISFSLALPVIQDEIWALVKEEISSFLTYFFLTPPIAAPLSVLGSLKTKFLDSMAVEIRCVSVHVHAPSFSTMLEITFNSCTISNASINCKLEKKRRIVFGGIKAAIKPIAEPTNLLESKFAIPFEVPSTLEFEISTGNTLDIKAEATHVSLEVVPLPIFIPSMRSIGNRVIRECVRKDYWNWHEIRQFCNDRRQYQSLFQKGKPTISTFNQLRVIEKKYPLHLVHFLHELSTQTISIATTLPSIHIAIGQFVIEHQGLQLLFSDFLIYNTQDEPFPIRGSISCITVKRHHKTLIWQEPPQEEPNSFIVEGDSWGRTSLGVQLLPFFAYIAREDLITLMMMMMQTRTSFDFCIGITVHLKSIVASLDLDGHSNVFCLQQDQTSWSDDGTLTIAELEFSMKGFRLAKMSGIKLLGNYDAKIESVMADLHEEPLAILLQEVQTFPPSLSPLSSSFSSSLKIKIVRLQGTLFSSQNTLDKILTCTIAPTNINWNANSFLIEGSVCLKETFPVSISAGRFSIESSPSLIKVHICDLIGSMVLGDDLEKLCNSILLFFNSHTSKSRSEYICVVESSSLQFLQPQRRVQMLVVSKAILEYSSNSCFNGEFKGVSDGRGRPNLLYLSHHHPHQHRLTLSFDPDSAVQRSVFADNHVSSPQVPQRCVDDDDDDAVFENLITWSSHLIFLFDHEKILVLAEDLLINFLPADLRDLNLMKNKFSDWWGHSTTSKSNLPVEIRANGAIILPTLDILSAYYHPKQLESPPYSTFYAKFQDFIWSESSLLRLVISSITGKNTTATTGEGDSVNHQVAANLFLLKPLYIEATLHKDHMTIVEMNENPFHLQFIGNNPDATWYFNAMVLAFLHSLPEIFDTAGTKEEKSPFKIALLIRQAQLDLRCEDSEEFISLRCFNLLVQVSVCRIYGTPNIECSNSSNIRNGFDSMSVFYFLKGYSMRLCIGSDIETNYHHTIFTDSMESVASQLVWDPVYLTSVVHHREGGHLFNNLEQPFYASSIIRGEFITRSSNEHFQHLDDKENSQSENGEDEGSCYYVNDSVQIERQAECYQREYVEHNVRIFVPLVFNGLHLYRCYQTLSFFIGSLPVTERMVPWYHTRFSIKIDVGITTYLGIPSEKSSGYYLSAAGLSFKRNSVFGNFSPNVDLDTRCDRSKQEEESSKIRCSLSKLSFGAFAFIDDEIAEHAILISDSTILPSLFSRLKKAESTPWQTDTEPSEGSSAGIKLCDLNRHIFSDLNLGLKLMAARKNRFLIEKLVVFNFDSLLIRMTTSDLLHFIALWDNFKEKEKWASSWIHRKQVYRPIDSVVSLQLKYNQIELVLMHEENRTDGAMPGRRTHENSTHDHATDNDELPSRTWGLGKSYTSPFIKISLPHLSLKDSIYRTENIKFNDILEEGEDQYFFPDDGDSSSILSSNTSITVTELCDDLCILNLNVDFTGIKINFFNIENFSWEPVLEPWNFSLSLEWRFLDTMGITAAIDFSMSSETNLEFVISSLFLKYATLYWQRMQVVPIANSSANTRMALLVRNFTGSDIMLWPSFGQTVLDNDGSKICDRLTSTSGIYWHFPVQHQESESLPFLNFHFLEERFPFESIRNIAISREGSSLLALRPSLDGKNHFIVNVVDNNNNNNTNSGNNDTTMAGCINNHGDSDDDNDDDGAGKGDHDNCDVHRENVPIIAKRIELRSAMLIHNHSNLIVEAMFFIPDRLYQNRELASFLIPQIWTMVIPSCSYRGVPPDIAFYSQFRIRPIDTQRYIWSSDAVNWRQFLAGENVELISNPEISESDTITSLPISFVVHGERLDFVTQPKAADEYPLWCFHLLPPLILVNELPFVVLFKVLDNRQKINFRGQLEPHCGIHLHHLVLLIHNYGKEPSILGLLLEIPSLGYFTKSPALIFHSNAKNSRGYEPKYVDRHMTLVASNAPPLTLMINYSPIEHSDLVRKVEIYAPYLISNQARLDIPLLLTSAGTLTEIPHLFPYDDGGKDGALMLYSLGSKQQGGGERLLSCMRTRNTEWSKPFSLEVVGSIISIELKSIDKITEPMYQLGLSVQLYPRFHLSKMILIKPRFLFYSTLPFDLAVSSETTSDDDLNIVVTGHWTPFHFHRSGPTVYIRRLGQPWSQEVPIAQIGTYYQLLDGCRDSPITITPPSHPLVRINVMLEGPTFHIRLMAEPTYPYLLVNKSLNFSITCHQVGSDLLFFLPAINAVGKTQPAQVPFFWDLPARTEKRLALWVDEISPKKKEIDISEVGHLEPIKIKSKDSYSMLVVRVDLRVASKDLDLNTTSDKQIMVTFEEIEGVEHLDPSQIIMNRIQRWRFKQSVKKKLKAMKRARKQTLPDTLQITSFTTTTTTSESGDERVSLAGDERVSLSSLFGGINLNLELRGRIGLSLVENINSGSASNTAWMEHLNVVSEVEEIAYLSVERCSLRLSLGLGPNARPSTLRLFVDWMQIDNQCALASETIVFYPTVLRRRNASNKLETDELERMEHPFLKLILIEGGEGWNSLPGIACFRYCGLLLQEISLELDDYFLRRLEQFLSNCTGWSIIPGISMADKITSLMLYFEWLQIHPVKINLSMSRAEMPPHLVGNSLNQPPSTLEVLLATLGSIHEAPLRFNALILQNPMVSLTLLVEMLQQHYGQQLVQQMHKIIGAADVVGNPIGVFSSVATGVTDLFYEPYLGFISDKPQDFGIGIAKGSVSLIKNTVFGISDAISRVTSSVGKGLSATTLDSEFQRERRWNQRKKNRPRHALSGVTEGTLSLMSSIASGLTGIVERPIEGIKHHGLPGFIKGIGKGLVGAVTKPMVGVFDFTSSISEGIKNTTTLIFDEEHLARCRPPRHLHFDGRIPAVYDLAAAEAQLVMREAENGRFLGLTMVGSWLVPIASLKKKFSKKRGVALLILHTRGLLVLGMRRSFSAEALWFFSFSKLLRVDERYCADDHHDHHDHGDHNDNVADGCTSVAFWIQRTFLEDEDEDHKEEKYPPVKMRIVTFGDLEAKQTFLVYFRQIYALWRQRNQVDPD